MQAESITKFMEKRKMRYKLTKDELDIEKNVLNYVELNGNEKNELNNIIDNINKKKAITLRLNENDLEKIKYEAEREGIPYQTFISSILHKYISHQLIEEKYIKKLKELFVH